MLANPLPRNNISRRQFIARSSSLAAGAALGFMQRTSISRIHLAAPPGFQALSGLRMAFVADLHLSVPVSRDFLASVAKAVSALSPHLLLLGGDYATAQEGRPEWIDEALGIFASVHAPLGRFAVAGNHDATLRPGAVFGDYTPHGITPLVNEGVVVPFRSSRFFLAGLDDLGMGRPVAKEALRGHDGSPVVIMCHEPDVFMLDDTMAPSWLALAGHLHAGQIRVPFWGPVVTATAYPKIFDWGWASANGRRVYVTRGVGATYPIPGRLFCPGEICLFEIT